MMGSIAQELKGPAGDDELMSLVRQGDLAALGELVVRHQHLAWRIAYRFVGDAAEAEDLAQEAFLRILQGASRYRPTAQFATYLSRVLVRLCLDYRQKKRPSYTGAVPTLMDKSSRPLDHVAGEERDRDVQSALAQLPPNQRIAVVLRYYEGQSYIDIADALGVSPKAVERLLSRARKALQSRLSCWLP